MISTLDQIKFILNAISIQCALENETGFTGLAKSLEPLTKNLFMLLQKKEFDEIPAIVNCNNETIEYCAKDGTAYQVTTNKEFKKKCSDTIDAFLEKRRGEEKLQIIYYRMLEEKDKRTKKNLNDIYSGRVVIYDIDDICKMIQDCNVYLIQQVFNLLQTFYPIDFANVALDTFTTNYDVCKGYIERKFTIENKDDVLIEVANSDDLLRDYHRMVIYADASAGKSELLRHINNIRVDKKLCVYLFDLKNYRGSKIEDIVPHAFLLYSRPLLLLDAFDEIKHEFVSDFIKEINTFSQKFQYCQIVITSRYNFLPSGNITFDNFDSCFMNDLTQEDVESFFKDKFKNRATKKYELCEKLNISNLLTNPFYLNRVVEVLEENDNVSNKAEIMENILRIDYKKFNEKHPNIYSFDEIKNILQEFAVYLFKNEEIECEIKDCMKLDHDVMRSFSWLLYQDGKVGFIHNNFKEYLIALYMQTLKYNKIVKLITIRIDKPYIKTKYANILGFMLALNMDKRLYNYLLSYGIHIVLDLDYSILEEEQKVKIVDRIYNEYEKLKSWPNAYLYQDSKVAKICDSRWIIKQLISKLEPTSHRTINIFTIDILRQVKSLFGFEEELKNKVLRWLIDEEFNDPAVISELIYFLEKLNIEEKQVGQIYLKYKDHSVSRVRASANYLIKEYKLAARYLPELLEGLKKGELKLMDSNFSSDDIIDAGENYYIQQAIKEINDDKSLSVLLDYIIEQERKFENNSLVEIVFDILKRKKVLGKEVKNKLYTLIINACQNFTNGLLKIAVGLINDCDLNSEFVNKIICDADVKDYIKKNMIARLATIDCLQYIIKYIKSKNEAEIMSFLSWLRTYNENFQDLLVELNNNGINCDLKEDDYELTRMKQCQKHFNILFKKTELRGIIQKVIHKVDGDKISTKKLRDCNIYSDTNLPFYIYSIFDVNDEAKDEETIMQRVTKQWQIYKIYEMLHNNKEIKVNRQQQSFIEKWVHEQLKVIDFKRGITYGKDNSWRTDWAVLCCDYFIRRFDIRVNQTIYEDMICFTGSGRTYTENEELEYLEKKLGVEIFKKQLSYYCNKGVLQGYVLSTRIQYCIKKEYDILLDCVLKKISMIQYNVLDPHFSVYIEYLKKFGYLDKVFDFYEELPIEIKLELLYLCINSSVNKERLLKYAEKDLDKNHEKCLELSKMLLLYHSEKALLYYYKYVKKHGFDYKYPVNIKAYQYRKYFKILCALLNLTYQDDNDQLRMRNDIMFCFERMCVNASLKEARDIIKRICKFIKKSHYKDINYLHYYVDGIKLQIIGKID